MKTWEKQIHFFEIIDWNSSPLWIPCSPTTTRQLSAINYVTTINADRNVASSCFRRHKLAAAVLLFMNVCFKRQGSSRAIGPTNALFNLKYMGELFVEFHSSAGINGLGAENRVQSSGFPKSSDRCAGHTT